MPLAASDGVTVVSEIEATALSSVTCVTVTFNPDLPTLKKQLLALPAESCKLIVDNASGSVTVQELKRLVGEFTDAHLLCNDRNMGLAAGINRGVAAIDQYAPDSRFVLLLDQDSEPQSLSVAVLLDNFRMLAAANHAVGCVGPLLRDAQTGLSHGFHQMSRWRWWRVYPGEGQTFPVRCVNLNGSGSLMPVDLFRRLGGMDEALFIDHVDTEWAFRVQDAQYELWGIPASVFIHRMGQSSMRYWWLGWRVWPTRSPRRHYFLYRNAVTLMRRAYVPRVWKVWGFLKLMLTALVHLSFDRERGPQLRAMLYGVREGLKAPRDPMRSHGNARG